MYRKGQKVQLKDIPFSEYDNMFFQDKETYELYFAQEGIVVAEDDKDVKVVFNNEIETISKKYIEPCSHSDGEFTVVVIDAGNDHIDVQLFASYFDAVEYARNSNDIILFEGNVRVNE